MVNSVVFMTVTVPVFMCMMIHGKCLHGARDKDKQYAHVYVCAHVYGYTFKLHACMCVLFSDTLPSEYSHTFKLRRFAFMHGYKAPIRDKVAGYQNCEQKAL